VFGAGRRGGVRRRRSVPQRRRQPLRAHSLASRRCGLIPDHDVIPDVSE
jgi:hypothetical protein